jgi:predicted RNase H-like HicB family nuclease
MRVSAVLEKCSDTGLYVGYIPGLRGGHSQGEAMDELNLNLKEVVVTLNNRPIRRRYHYHAQSVTDI